MAKQNEDSRYQVGVEGKGGGYALADVVTNDPVLAVEEVAKRAGIRPPYEGTATPMDSRGACTTVAVRNSSGSWI